MTTLALDRMFSGINQELIRIAFRWNREDDEIGLIFHLPNEVTVYMTEISFCQFRDSVNDLREERVVFGRAFSIDYERGLIQFFNKGACLTFETNEKLVKSFIYWASSFISRINEERNAQAA